MGELFLHMYTTTKNNTGSRKIWRIPWLDLVLVIFAYAMWFHYLWRYRGLIARLLQ